MIVDEFQKFFCAFPAVSLEPDTQKGGHAGVEEGTVKFQRAGIYTIQLEVASVDIPSADLQIGIRQFLKQRKNLNVRDVDPIELPMALYVVEKLPETVFQSPGFVVGAVVLPQGGGHICREHRVGSGHQFPGILAVGVEGGPGNSGLPADFGNRYLTEAFFVQKFQECIADQLLCLLEFFVVLGVHAVFSFAVACFAVRPEGALLSPSSFFRSCR